jgi:hypothetical protein
MKLSALALSYGFALRLMLGRMSYCFNKLGKLLSQANLGDVCHPELVDLRLTFSPARFSY